MGSINQLLHVIRFIVRWPMTTIGVMLSLWSRYLDYEDTIALGIKPDIWLLIGLVVFFLSVILMLAKFQRQLSKRSNGIPLEKEAKSEKDGVSISNSYSTGNVTAGKGSSNVGGLIGGINSQSVTGYDQRYADWMTTALNRDKYDFLSCIKVGEPRIIWNQLLDTDSSLELRFDIWSSSVYLLEIGNKIEGHMKYQGEELERLPEVIKGIKKLKRSDRGELRLKQWFSQAMMHRVALDGGENVTLSFNQVNIFVESKAPDGTDGPTCRLPLPDGVTRRLPTLKELEH